MAKHLFDRRKIPEGASFHMWKAPDGWDYRRLAWPQAVAGTARHGTERGGKVRGSLLFAGGRGDFIEKYLEPMDHWHRAGWNVEAFDWRSQGGSRGDIAGGHLSSMDPLVSDLDALIADWRSATPGPHVVIGHSMGGHVLLRTIAETQPRIEAAVLVAPMLMINSGPLPGMAAWWLAAAASFFGMAAQPVWQQRAPDAPRGSFRQSLLTSCAERFQDELWWWEQQPGFNLGAPSWGWIEAAYRSCAKLTPARLGAIDTPILLLGTERDKLVSPAAIRSAASLIPSAELKMYPDAGHEILRESDPVRLDAHGVIDAFFDRSAPA
jgi:lysophospholipase